MPAAGNPPGLAEFLKGYEDGVRGGGAGDAREDVRRGSGYDVPGGVSALAWARQAPRDQALFRQSYTETADGADLDRHIALKYRGVSRVVDTFGEGSLAVARPSASGGAGRFWDGTRVEVVRAGQVAVYAVDGDQDVDAAATGAQLAIRATVPGPAGAVSAASSELRFADGIFDPTFQPLSLACGPGTLLESASSFRARARQAKKDARVGYPASITASLKGAGATRVVLLDAAALGPALDSGLSYAYVGDANFSTPPALLDACFYAFDDWAAAGVDIQLLGMSKQIVRLKVAITTWQSLDHYDTGVLGSAITAALVDAFVARQKWWTYRLAELEGVVQRESSAFQTVAITATPAPPPVGFPAVLTRYELDPTGLTIAFSGPT